MNDAPNANATLICLVLDEMNLYLLSIMIDIIANLGKTTCIRNKIDTLRAQPGAQLYMYPYKPWFFDHIDNSGVDIRNAIMDINNWIWLSSFQLLMSIT